MQQAAGALQPKLEVVAQRGRLEMLAKAPLELAQRQAGGGAQPPPGHRLVEMILHQRDDLAETGVGHALANVRLHPLAVLRVADVGMDELLRHRRGQAPAMPEGDQMQHHVERRRAAGAGEAVPIDDEEAALDLDLGEALAKAVEALPMGGRAMAVEQPGPGQQERAGVHGAEIAAQPVGSPEPGSDLLIVGALRLEAGTDHQLGIDGRAAGAAVGDQRHAVAGGDRRAVGGDDLPAIERPAGQAIGYPQRLDCRDERHHRKPGHQQEADRLRLARRTRARHDDSRIHCRFPSC